MIIEMKKTIEANNTCDFIAIDSTFCYWKNVFVGLKSLCIMFLAEFSIQQDSARFRRNWCHKMMSKLKNPSTKIDKLSRIS